MTRFVPRRHPRKPRKPRGTELDQASEVLRLVGRLLVSNGYSPAELSRTFATICAALPHPRTPFDPARSVFTAELGHVLTYWYTDPLCLDSRGEPRPLPASGPGRSIADLVRRASPTLEPASAIKILMKSRSLKRRGKLFTPTGRKVIFDPKDAAAAARSLLPLIGFLETFDFNVNRRGKQPARFEATAINPAFPVKALEAFKTRLTRRGTEFLHELDTEMRRAEERGGDDTARARVGVGLFMFEEAPATGRALRRRESRR